MKKDEDQTAQDEIVPNAAEEGKDVNIDHASPEKEMHTEATIELSPEDGIDSSSAGFTPHPNAPSSLEGSATPPPSHGTSAPKLGEQNSGTQAPDFSSSSSSGGGGTASYPPLPPRAKKKGLLAGLTFMPILVIILLVIIVILFIWGITAHEHSSQQAPKQAPAKKVLQVAPMQTPGVGTPEPAPRLSAEQNKELMAARTAYWQHDLSASIQQYQALIKQVPNAAFAYGELGNVYYMMGNREKAAQSFEHAALLLIQQGQVQRASSLIPVLGALDPALAQKVQVALSHSPEDPGYSVPGAQ